jgi:hypothetical protein
MQIRQQPRNHQCAERSIACRLDLGPEDRVGVMLAPERDPVLLRQSAVEMRTRGKLSDITVLLASWSEPRRLRLAGTGGDCGALTPNLRYGLVKYVKSITHHDGLMVRDRPRIILAQGQGRQAIFDIRRVARL